jgi:hypothetical protein
MKAISWVLIILPATLLAAAFLLIERDIGFFLVWSWIISAAACLAWGFYVFRRDKPLGLGCIVMGCAQMTLVLLLPLRTPTKTPASWVPNHRASLDAAVAFSLHSERRWRRASEPER